MVNKDKETGESIRQVLYSPEEVTFLLGYYLEFKSNQLSPTTIPEDPSIIGEYKTVNKYKHEMPLGHKHSDYPWPFMVKRHAPTRVDGKRRAIKSQDIVVAMIDLEEGLCALTDNYLELIYKYYMFESRTLQELAHEQGLSHPSTVLRRCERALRQLTKHMNSGAKPIK